jgi:hypothetical protein
MKAIYTVLQSLPREGTQSLRLANLTLLSLKAVTIRLLTVSCLQMLFYCRVRVGIARRIWDKPVPHIKEYLVISQHFSLVFHKFHLPQNVFVFSKIMGTSSREYKS